MAGTPEPLSTPHPSPVAARALRARRRRRRRARLLLLTAATVLALLTWGLTDPAHLLIVHDLLDHPILLGALAWALAVAGVAGHLDDGQHRIVAAIMLGGVGITCFGLAGLVISSQVSRERGVEVLPAPAASPNASSSASSGGGLEAVVERNGDESRPTTTVVVRDRTWSLTAHRHDVACLAPAPGSPAASVSWAGPRALRVSLAGGVHRIDLDDTGRPTQVLRVGVRCSG